MSPQEFNFDKLTHGGLIANNINEPEFASQVSEDELIAHLLFNETQGVRASDTSSEGNDNNGWLRNEPTFEAVGGDLGGILNLDGSDDYVQIGNSSDINLGIHSQRTISIRFKVDDKDIADRKQVIYEEGNASRGLNIYIDNGNLYVGGWNRPSSESRWLGTYLDTDAISSDTWHHVTLVLDGNETLEAGAFSAYLDGVKFGDGEGSQLWEHRQATGIGALVGGTRFKDGTSSGTGTQAFAGSLDDLRIYNRVLDDTEIAALANPVADLVTHLEFDETTGTKAVDTSAYGNDNIGRLRNGATIEAAEGDLSGVLNLDGSDDHVQISNSSDINLGTHGQRTISIRFKVDDKDIADRKQVIYEEGGISRGLNIYIENGNLYVGGWNRPSSESRWMGTYLDTDAISSDTWHHVTLVLDGDETLESGAFSAYLDGEKFGEGLGSQLWEHRQATGIGALVGNTRFHDGTSTGTGTQAFAGSLDDLRIYNRVLTAEEICDLADCNHDPIATDDEAEVDEDTSITLSADYLLDNDYDPDGDTLEIIDVGDAVNGTVELNADGNVEFTPDPDFPNLEELNDDGYGYGDASFSYTISDGKGGTDMATVNVKVNPINDDPVAMDDEAETKQGMPITLLAADLLSNDTDVDRDTLEITEVGDAVNGTVELNADGNVEFTPDAGFSGEASFDYTISDGNGGTDTATVYVTIDPDPIATDDEAEVDEDTTLIPDNLLDNDSGVAPLEITGVGDAVNGTVELNDGNVEFTPDPDFNGDASFSYTIKNANGETDMATVDVTVNPINDDPVAMEDMAETKQDTSITFPAHDLLDNDYEVDLDPLEIIGVGNAINGTVVEDENGNFKFTPETGFVGEASFDYTVSDGNGGTDTATVTIEVKPEGAVPLGTNVGGLSYWSNLRGLLDVFKSSGSWLTQEGGTWSTGEEHLLDLDENGWVRSLPTPQDGVEYDVASVLTGQFDPAHGDRYVVLYDGEGTLEYRFAATKDEAASSPGRDVLDVTRTDKSLLVKITSTDPNDTGDYIRNIRIVPEAYEATYETDIFNPTWIEKTDPFESVRFMDLMSTNGSSLSEWSDRPKLDDYTFDHTGAPVELLVDFANRVDADPWFTLPHEATDEFVTNFAQYVKDNLDPDLDIYVEYSNEVWNSQFSQAQWVTQQANLEWPDSTDSNFTQRMDWYSKRTTEVMQIWDDVFDTDKERVIGVMGAQAGNSWTGDRTLDYHWTDNPLSHEEYGIDAITIAPYFGGYIGNRQHEAQIESWLDDADGGLNKLFDELTHGGVLRDAPEGGALQQAFSRMDNYVEIADEHGLDLIAYEGGQHLAGTGGVQNNSGISDLFIAANRDPRMGELYEQYFEGWYEREGGLFVHFNDVGTPSKWGSWGALEDINQTSSPKYDALIDLLG